MRADLPAVPQSSAGFRFPAVSIWQGDFHDDVRFCFAVCFYQVSSVRRHSGIRSGAALDALCLVWIAGLRSR